KHRAMGQMRSLASIACVFCALCRASAFINVNQGCRATFFTLQALHDVAPRYPKTNLTGEFNQSD
ncbi:MAG: hypothetical protein ACRC4U_11840, partial [Shewanella sp.]